ncbi:MAG: hypothetical protein A2987_05520 [Omnitrophica bacterium RIFCSPLOWO2_01_FULL_45_10]|nr:MAG: hypothetical protein A2987_05520 [Omnitrophica bacterium RIFCSPLOWO2_01_FULL_45_10]
MVNQALLRTKTAHIKKSMDRLLGKAGVPRKEFRANADIQDIVTHNLQLAIQGAIDIASHIISDEGWGVPNTLVGLFEILREHKVIDEKMSGLMKKMVGFRNIIVHEYDDIDLNKVHQILTERLGDFDDFLKQITMFANL